MSPAPGSAKPHLTHTIRRVVIALAVGVGIGAAVVVGVTVGDDDRSSSGTTARTADVQASCHTWMASSSRADGRSDHWCTDMFAWMSDQSDGSMMWRGPEHLSTACRAWVARDGAPADGQAAQRCTDMVDWMDHHMSSPRGDWMMRDR